MSSKSIVTGFIPGEDLMETNCNDKYKHKRKKRACAVDTYVTLISIITVAKTQIQNTKRKKEAWAVDARRLNTTT